MNGVCGSYNCPSAGNYLSTHRHECKRQTLACLWLTVQDNQKPLLNIVPNRTAQHKKSLPILNSRSDTITNKSKSMRIEIIIFICWNQRVYVYFSFYIKKTITTENLQGQPLDTVGILLTQPLFTHGQLYVARSCVRYFVVLRFLYTWT